MTLAHLLRILRAHRTVIGLILLIALGIALAITAVMPRVYIGSSTIVVDFRNSNPVSGDIVPAQLYGTYLSTQIDVLSSQAVALKVVDDLQLMHSERNRARFFPAYAHGVRNLLSDFSERTESYLPPAVNEAIDSAAQGPPQGRPSEDYDANAMLRYRLADRLLENLSIRPSADSSAIRVSFGAAEPRAAAEAANAFVRAYTATNLEMSVQPAQLSSDWFTEQIALLTHNLEQARAKYTKFQQDTGIVAIDETVDVESLRLADLASQYVSAQVEDHPSIQALKNDLARAEAKLASLPPQLGPNHPQYRQASQEVRQLEARLADRSSAISGDIRREMGSQKARVLEMKKQRATLAALKDTVDSAQRSLDEVIRRSSEVQLESRINQTNVSVVRAAVPPASAARPNLTLNLLIALFVGGIVGIGLALWRELSRRYVRYPEDLPALVGLPVLGVLVKHGNRLPAPAMPRLITGR